MISSYKWAEDGARAFFKRWPAVLCVYEDRIVKQRSRQCSIAIEHTFIVYTKLYWCVLLYCFTMMPSCETSVCSTHCLRSSLAYGAWLRPIIFCLSLITHALPTSLVYRRSALRPEIPSLALISSQSYYTNHHWFRERIATKWSFALIFTCLCNMLSRN